MNEPPSGIAIATRPSDSTRPALSTMKGGSHDGRSGCRTRFRQYSRRERSRFKTASDLDTRKVTVTFIKDETGQDMRARRQTLPALAAHIAFQTAASKMALPWLKLVMFGNKRSEKNSLRTNENVEKLSGIEAGDLFGEGAHGQRSRVLRTSNGYRFTEPPDVQRSESELPSRTEGQELLLLTPAPSRAVMSVTTDLEAALLRLEQAVRTGG